MKARDNLRAFGVWSLGDLDTVLILDQTWLAKQGIHPARVARQYTATTGRIDNPQFGPFVTRLTLAGIRMTARRTRPSIPRINSSPEPWQSVVPGEGIIGRVA